MPEDRSGFHDGRHYTEWVETVKVKTGAYDGDGPASQLAAIAMTCIVQVVISMLFFVG